MDITTSFAKNPPTQKASSTAHFLVPYAQFPSSADPPHLVGLLPHSHTQPSAFIARSRNFLTVPLYLFPAYTRVTRPQTPYQYKHTRSALVTLSPRSPIHTSCSSASQTLKTASPCVTTRWPIPHIHDVTAAAELLSKPVTTPLLTLYIFQHPSSSWRPTKDRRRHFLQIMPSHAHFPINILSCPNTRSFCPQKLPKFSAPNHQTITQKDTDLPSPIPTTQLHPHNVQTDFTPKRRPI